MFSSIQNIHIDKMHKTEVKARLQDALMQFAFAVLMCIRQSRSGRFFMVEHPVAASLWSMQLTSVLCQCPNIKRVIFYVCMVGMQSSDDAGKGAVEKRVSVMTNSKILAETLLQYQCDRAHRHVILENGRANNCEEYLD